LRECFIELANFVVSNEAFCKNHVKILEDIVYSLELESTNNIIDINKAWKVQVDLEVAVVFLVGYYNSKLSKSNIVSDHKYSEALLSVPDKPTNSLRKYTVDEKKSLVKIDKSVYRGMLVNSLLSDLVKNLESLQRIVFSRNKKLESLTINYRRELESESNV
jgi:hypothetical protein